MPSNIHFHRNLLSLGSETELSTRRSSRSSNFPAPPAPPLLPLSTPAQNSKFCINQYSPKCGFPNKIIEQSSIFRLSCNDYYHKYYFNLIFFTIISTLSSSTNDQRTDWPGGELDSNVWGRKLYSINTLINYIIINGYKFKSILLYYLN